MRIGVKRNSYIAMPHKVLQCLWIHAGFRHIAAIRVPANMRRDIQHLHPIDIVVPLHHVVKAMFPMPDIAANSIPVAFGDLSYFWILERQPLSVKILTELYARENQTGYAAYERIDGKLIRPEAVQFLKVK